MAALLVTVVTYGYLALVANPFDPLETTRYREEVERIILLITVICLGELRARARRRRGAAAGHPGV